MEIEERLKTLGITLPEPSKSLGFYVPIVRSGNLLFMSGIIPIKNGNVITGKFGYDLKIDDAETPATAVVLAIISNLKNELKDLDKVNRIIKIEGFVNSTLDFKDQPKVLNAVSELLVKVFGEKGKHSRTAIGVSSLPMGACLEVSSIFETI